MKQSGWKINFFEILDAQLNVPDVANALFDK